MAIAVRRFAYKCNRCRIFAHRFSSFLYAVSQCIRTVLERSHGAVCPSPCRSLGSQLGRSLAMHQSRKASGMVRFSTSLLMPEFYALRIDNPDTTLRHTLSNDEKLAYIDAELCLMRKPASLGLPGSKTRFDDLQAVHQLQAYSTHFVVSCP